MRIDARNIKWMKGGLESSDVVGVVDTEFDSRRVGCSRGFEVE